jgi:hypothetical protein
MEAAGFDANHLLTLRLVSRSLITTMVKSKMVSKLVKPPLCLEEWQKFGSCCDQRASQTGLLLIIWSSNFLEIVSLIVG